MEDFPIQAILFDMGGTLRLRTTEQDEPVRDQKISELLQLLDSDRKPEEFFRLMLERSKAYHAWAESTHVELNEKQLWTLWMLPEWPEEEISPLSMRLNRLWREATGKRDPYPQSKNVIEKLFHKGYRLGVVSNTTSSTEIPDLLRKWQISGLFEVIILSCEVGKRKGDPDILLEAARRMGISPEHCAYIGDRPDRDVAAARKAGFSKTIILRNPQQPEASMTDDPDLVPDHSIRDIAELVDLFPAISSWIDQTEEYPPKDRMISLSTMWAISNFPTLQEFYIAARRFGFTGIELNHQVNSAMLAGIDLNRSVITSVHEPCPADIRTEELKAKDWLISAEDEHNRREGVVAVQHSIDLAASLGVKVIVVHAGNVRGDWPTEKKLYEAYHAGQAGTREYLKLKAQLEEERAAYAEARMNSVKKSLVELLEYCRPLSIQLGLENRYHYMDIPLIDELSELLVLGNPAELGFWYDSGHAQTLDRLGFITHEDWLRRFSNRIVGMHLHDVVGISDHCVPGSGDIDFNQIKKYIPAGAIITLELKSSMTPEQVKNGLQLLDKKDVLR